MKINNPLPNLNISNLNPLLLGDILFRKDKRVDLFLELEDDKRVELLRSVTKPVRRDIMMRIPEPQLAKLLQSVDPDEATDMLQQLTKKKREKILKLISVELRDSLSQLLAFDANTAAGLMTLDYIQVDESDNIETTAEKFRNHEKQTGRPPIILVTKETKLVGFLPGHELGLKGKKEKVGKHIRRIHTISYAAKHNEVIQLFRSHPHSKMAVLNDKDEVIGIIYSDDVLQLIDDQRTNSLYKFAGINVEESVSDSAHKKVKYRYKWLIINLGTAFLAAFTVGMFEETLDKYVLLAVYMPIVAGMGGNAATQTLAVLVRGIALKQIELKTAWRTLKNEVSAGLFNGFINGLLVATVVIIMNGDVKVAMVLAIAMVVNLVVAGFFGTLVPLIMSKFGKDPATSATIFITTATDVLGFLVFLGLGTIILG